MYMRNQTKSLYRGILSIKSFNKHTSQTLSEEPYGKSTWL